MKLTIISAGIITAFSVLPLSFNSQATEHSAIASDAIYVSVQGKANNNGSQASPFNTLAKALKKVQPGQNIYLREGVYQGTEKLRNINGKKGKRITISAFPGEKVIFDGTRGVDELASGKSLAAIQAGGTGWLPHQGNIYKMHLSQDVWQLFVLNNKGAQQMVPARWPNAKFSDGSIYKRSAWATARNATKAEGRHSTNPVMNKIKNGITSQQMINKCFNDGDDLTDLTHLQSLNSKYCLGVSIDAPPESKRVLSEAEQKILKKRPWKSINNNADVYGHDLSAQNFDATGAMAILNYGHWRTWARPVVSHKGDSFTHIATPHLYGTGHYYYLEAALSLLDQEEEWFFDKDTKTLYLWAPNSIALNEQSLLVRAKVQANAFTIRNADYVNFENLDFFATTFTCNNCDQMVFDNLNLEYAGSSKRMLRHWGTVTTRANGKKNLVDAVPDIVMIDGKYKQNSDKSSHSIIRNSSFSDSDGPALQFHGNNNKIINNRFTNIDYNGAEGWPFQAAINTFLGKNTTFSYNTFYNTGLSQMYRAHSGDITHNFVDKIGWAQTDGAVIGANNTGLAVAYNWALSDHDKGIRIDAPFPPKHVSEWNTDNYIHHNVTMGNRGIVVKGWKHRIYNNTVVDIPYIDAVTGVVDPESPRLVLNNDTGLLKRHKVSEQQLGCKVGIDCGANLETISANNLAPYILAGLGRRIERKTSLLAQQSHDYETSLQGGVSVSDMLRDPVNYDFRAKVNAAIASQGVDLKTFTKTHGYSDYQGLPYGTKYIGAYGANEGHYNIPGQRQKYASFPIPLHGSTKVKRDTDLMWREALGATGYRLYFGSNKKVVAEATDAANSNDISQAQAIYQARAESYRGIRSSNNIYKPENLVAGKDYFWRVDAVVGKDVQKGKVWKFTVESKSKSKN